MRTGSFWRIFPWNPDALPGEPYSATYVPPAGSQTGGRFDLGDVPVLYLAESPEHAVAEILRRFAGKPLRRSHLRRRDRTQPATSYPLALVAAEIPTSVAERLADLTDPVTLTDLGIRPDRLASEDRRVTQAISRAIYERGYPGFRWWSALKGDWHATILYLDRIDSGAMRYGNPDPLHPQHAVVARVCDELRMPHANLR